MRQEAAAAALAINERKLPPFARLLVIVSLSSLLWAILGAAAGLAF